MLPRFAIIRRQDFKTAPWKNGGGVTYEALRAPATGDRFDWRVSVARVAASGPFSDFAGYRRFMVLLEGEGVELRFGDGTLRRLDKVGSLAEFDGAMPTHGELPRGACMDLNLMVREALPAAARVEGVSGQRMDAADGSTVLILPIDGALRVAVEGGETSRLDRWDLGVLSGGSARIHRPQDRAAGQVFIARVARELP